jgi:non-heme chloroperoxidase
MANVEVEGVSLFYSESGSGAPVVLVHGIPTDLRAWDAQVESLAPRFRIIRYSRRYARPNARSGDLSDSTIENNARDLSGVISQLGPPPVHLVGHSYGGFVAAYLASHEPKLLRSLTLVEPAIASLLLKDPKSRGEALSLLFRHPRVALSASRFLRTSNDPALAALQRNDLEGAVRFNVDGVEDRHGAYDGFPDEIRQMVLDNARTVKETGLPYPALSREDLGRVRVPTLMVHGETSVFWLRAVARMAAAAIPGCETVMIPSSGHYPHFENRAAFNSAIERFLTRIESAG